MGMWLAAEPFLRALPAPAAQHQNPSEHRPVSAPPKTMLVLQGPGVIQSFTYICNPKGYFSRKSNVLHFQQGGKRAEQARTPRTTLLIHPKQILEGSDVALASSATCRCFKMTK